MNQEQYYKHAQETFSLIEKMFSKVATESLQCERGPESITLQLFDGTKFMLNMRVSVRQLVLTITSKEKAVYFDYHRSKGKWIDDKTGTIELFQYLKKMINDELGIEVQII